MQNRLDLIVGRVRNSDVRTVLSYGNILQELVANGTRRLFDSRSHATSDVGDVLTLYRQRNLQRLTKFTQPGDVRLRLVATQIVVEMRGVQTQPL